MKMHIGFDVSGESEAEQGIGFAEGSETEHWSEELPEYFLGAWMKFCLVYGIYASVRDLVMSLF
ncbi:MAG: hypothetical protein HOD37_15555 [Bacteroidetes bacterium]|nr:hypothetical protein [Bacteroidota bacterium]